MNTGSLSGARCRTVVLVGSAMVPSQLTFSCVNPVSGPTTAANPGTAISVSGSGIMRTVTISSATSGTRILCTVDATTPTSGSAAYTGTTTFRGGVGMSETINAITILSSGKDSPVASATASIASIPALSLTAAVSAIARSSSSGSTNDSATALSFNRPYAITSCATNLYVGNTHNNEIREIQ